MRILLANTGHPTAIKGGAEAAVLDLAHALAARGHSVALVVHHGGRAVEVSEDGGVRVYALPNRNLYFAFDGRKRPAPLRLAWHALDGANPFMAAAFGRILDAEKPDVVNTHVLAGLSQLLWREAHRRGIPVVHYLHEYGTMCPRGSAFRDGRLCARPCAPCGLLTIPRKRLSRLVDTVVGVSRFTLERHLAWGFFPNAARAVIPNVFTGLAFTPRAAPAEGPLRLGYFGRLIPDKGAHLLLAAAKRLPPEGWTLAVAGSGDEPYVAALKRDVPANVRFLGWARGQDFFPHMDALVVPSVWPDPQPRVVFEAYMHGVPVIGADAGGIPEQIDEDRTGWLFEAGSETDLARVLAARLADRRDRALNPQDFRNRLAALVPARVAALYEDVYTDAIGRRHAGSEIIPPRLIAST
ncbi:MAG TPA: glycosyltransferase family 4 protein [Beijerinckiaceae bacterium]|jgi:glycosyltransferase involved in cell wall biosynthesis